MNESFDLRDGKKVGDSSSSRQITIRSEHGNFTEYEFDHEQENSICVGETPKISEEESRQHSKIMESENLERKWSIPDMMKGFSVAAFVQNKKMLSIAAAVVLLLIILLIFVFSGKKETSQGIRSDGSFQFDNRNGGATELTFGSDGTTTIKQYK